MPFEDSPQEILAKCRNCIPVNELVINAIAAHRIAFAEYQQYGGNDARKVAMHALRAIITSATPLWEDDYRTQLDYLSELPLSAWEEQNGASPQKCRDDTLTFIARRIALS